VGYTPADDGREVFAEILSEPLDGGDFTVRHWRDDDIAPALALVDDELRRRLGFPAGLGETTARDLLLHGGAVTIADAGTDLPLGGMRVFLHDGGAVEFGYWLGPDGRGRGLASRGLQLLSDRVVAALDPARLELRTGVGNEPSERVAARAGYTRVGPEPPLVYPGGRVVETTLWVRDP
jgi:RimJ/RimL family protein N-acetyltransferase